MIFFKLYAFILLTSTLVPGINYFVVTTHPLHQLQVRSRNIHIEMLTATNMFVAIRAVLVLVRSSGIFDRNEQP